MRGRDSFGQLLSRRQMLLRGANGFGAVALTALLTERAFGSVLQPSPAGAPLASRPGHHLAKANLFLHTGFNQQGRPSMGAWVTYGLGSECQALPGYVVLKGGRIPAGGPDNFHSGFLPAVYQGSIFKDTEAPVANLQRTEAS